MSAQAGEKNASGLVRGTPQACSGKKAGLVLGSASSWFLESSCGAVIHVGHLLAVVHVKEGVRKNNS